MTLAAFAKKTFGKVTAPKPRRSEDKIMPETIYIRSAAAFNPDFHAKLPEFIRELDLESNYDSWRQADNAMHFYITPPTGKECTASNKLMAENLLALMGTKHSVNIRLIYAFKIAGSSYFKLGTHKCIERKQYAIHRYIGRSSFPRVPTDFDVELEVRRFVLAHEVEVPTDLGETPDKTIGDVLGIYARDSGLRHDDTEYWDLQLLPQATYELGVGRQSREHCRRAR